MKYSDNLNLAIVAAINAGVKIMKIYESEDFGVETKEDDTPLTRADKISHSVIVKALASSGLPLLSEEGGNIPFKERSTWSCFWMIDPIDGTKEFIKRNGEFTINIGMIRDGSPIMGVVYAPVLKELFFAEQSIGSFKMTHIQSLEDMEEATPRNLSTALLPDRYTLVVSKSHMNEATQKFLDNKELQHGIVNSASYGSSLKICKVADGSAHCYPRFGPTMEWDTVAAHAIASYAGCQVTQGDQKSPLLYNKENLLKPSFIIQR